MNVGANLCVRPALINCVRPTLINCVRPALINCVRPALIREPTLNCLLRTMDRHYELGQDIKSYGQTHRSAPT